jgi:hypothetical protein
MMRRYAQTDLEEMSGWYRARGLTPLSADVLPIVGFIEPDVAAGFLYLTDSSLCLLENYITNPRASPEGRNTALDAITGALLQEAERAGYRHAVALTQDREIRERALRHGLVPLGDYTLSHKELPWGS